ncbi:MAG: hypothetical protein JW927_06685 [Deltaproteobacteria bacterium]|nr:hypothetical protein [Deltaproteobacteria bacterium]
MHKILEMLRGGDKRSIGRSNEVVKIVLNEPGLFDTLFSGMLSDDPLISMRSADAVEKITALYPEYLKPYKKILLTTLAKAEQPEIRWHVAPMLARLSLTTLEQKAVIEELRVYMNDKSSIVKTMAMQAIYDLTERYEALRPLALLFIKELVDIGTPAMKARGKKLLPKLI